MQYIQGERNSSYLLSDAILADYEKKHRARQRTRPDDKYRPASATTAAIKRQYKQTVKGQSSTALLQLSWPDYVDMLYCHEARLKTHGWADPFFGDSDERGYLWTAEFCNKLFAKHGTFQRIPSDDRALVAGTIERGAFFGSMRGAGKFSSRIRNHPEEIEAALRHIPHSGPVTENQFNSFVEAFQLPGHALTTASRLLAMKRPDYFVCVTARNDKGLAEAAGHDLKSLKEFGGYWSLMSKIHSAPWWRSKCPTQSTEKRIWKARTALLDCAFYQPK